MTEDCSLVVGAFLTLATLLAGCSTLRETEQTRPDPIVRAVDVDVKVQEAPGLFQVTK